MKQIQDFQLMVYSIQVFMRTFKYQQVQQKQKFKRNNSYHVLNLEEVFIAKYNHLLFMFV